MFLGWCVGLRACGDGFAYSCVYLFKYLMKLKFSSDKRCMYVIHDCFKWAWPDDAAETCNALHCKTQKIAKPWATCSSGSSNVLGTWLLS